VEAAAIAFGRGLRQLPRATSKGRVRVPASTGGGMDDGDVMSHELPDHVVEAAKHRSHSAFAAIVDYYEPRLRATVFYVVQDEELSRDALQETFLRAYRALPRFRGDASLGTWLHRIAYTTSLEQLRVRRRRPETPLPADVDDAAVMVSDPGDDMALREIVSGAMAQLPPEQRLVLLLVDRDGYDYRTVAEIMGVSCGTVCSRLQRARGKLRLALAHEPQSTGFPFPTEES